MKLTEQEQREVDEWNPHMTTTWSNKVLRAWFEKWGHAAFYQGYMWRPKAEKLGAGMNYIVFRKWLADNPEAKA